MMRRGLMALLLSTLAASAVHAAPRFVAGPYKHTAIDAQPSHRIAMATNGTTTWAFATGECGDEKWGEETGEQIASANVPAFVQAGRDYIVSTGGQGGVFTCASDAGMERFVARYLSPHLVGFDFDIEEGQSVQQIAALVNRAVHVQRQHPRLRFSFTVATHAASDGSKKSLNQLGETILAQIRQSALRDYTINLMVMDYGVPLPENCVVRAKVCDMGASAIQAARNVHEKYGLPWSHMELTAMIGVNDVVNNDFTLAHARTMARAVHQLKLAGMHFWSLDRDQKCAGLVQGASSSCSGLDAPAGAFGRLLGR